MTALLFTFTLAFSFFIEPIMGSISFLGLSIIGSLSAALVITGRYRAGVAIALALCIGYAVSSLEPSPIAIACAASPLLFAALTPLATTAGSVRALRLGPALCCALICAVSLALPLVYVLVTTAVLGAIAALVVSRITAREAGGRYA